jgi:hypothetical protein
MRAAIKKQTAGITEKSAPMKLRMKWLLDLARVCARMTLFSTKSAVFLEITYQIPCFLVCCLKT